MGPRTSRGLGAWAWMAVLALGRSTAYTDTEEFLSDLDKPGGGLQESRDSLQLVLSGLHPDKYRNPGHHSIWVVNWCRWVEGRTKISFQWSFWLKLV
ncbi:unnamed protein product, partial [Iphiclides podalirius]